MMGVWGVVLKMGKREEEKKKGVILHVFLSYHNSICQPAPPKKKTIYKDSDEYFPKISIPVSQSTSNTAHNK